MKRGLRKSGFDYASLLGDVKSRIQNAQTRAVVVANAELVHLYWDIDRLIDVRQKEEGYGRGIIPRLLRDLHNELPEQKGVAARNIGLMIGSDAHLHRRLTVTHAFETRVREIARKSDPIGAIQ